MQLSAHRGVDPVRADEDVGFDRLQAAGGAVTQLGAYAAAGLLEARERPPAAHGARSESLLHGVEQHALQLAAVDRVLRPAVPGATAARLAADAVAEAVVVGELRGRHRDGLERLGEAELGQLADRVGEEVDAGADRLDAARGFDDRDIDARVVQADGGRQPADAAPGDQDPHGQRGAPKPAAGNCSSTIISARPPALIAYRRQHMSPPPRCSAALSPARRRPTLSGMRSVSSS